MQLAIFDLDHTLLDGDSDVLWCEFLMAEGELDRARFEVLNAAMERDYKAGTVGVQAFCDFYVGTLAGRTAAECLPLCQRFLHESVLPRLFPGTAALLQQHRQAGDLLLMSTATNRVITTLTAQALGFEHLIATECAVDETGRFSGATAGMLNMREGKVARLQQWLAAQEAWVSHLRRCFYSDSINDLPLLDQVDEPVVTNGDPRLQALAAERGWRTLSLS